MSFERLIREHDVLQAKAALLRAAVRGAPAPSKALSLLADFAMGIEEHRRFEQLCVYRPLLKIACRKDWTADLDLAAVVTEMEGDWSEYLHDWDLDCITADWATFAAETERVLARAAKRLLLENNIIYPLALKEGAINLREPPGPRARKCLQ